MRLLLLLILIPFASISQSNKSNRNPVARPKLVVGIVVDQMRWDYLYRYYDRYAPDGGFKRLINRGFSCENTFINYIPTVTACGHASLYTGSVPSINGIAGNEWYDRYQKRVVYNAFDDSVSGVGTATEAGKMSPKNLLSTTIGDELRLATNFRSKVIGISFKDRGAIMPAGKSANAAYWFDNASGNFITSTYYMQSLPQWINDFNRRKITDSFFRKGWNTLYPIETYRQSSTDEQWWEGKPFGENQTKFPYKLDQYIGGKSYGSIIMTPFGNTVLKELAMAAVKAEQLGKDSITDLLAVSFSTADYIGHTFGPNSIEAEDGFLRLDKDLGELFSFLDKNIGAGQYLVFLSADHGAAHSGGFSKNHKLPGGGFDYGILDRGVDSVLRTHYGNYKLLEASENSQLYFNHRLMDSLKIDRTQLYHTVTEYLVSFDFVDKAFAFDNVNSLPDFIRIQAINGHNMKRSGDVQIIFKPGFMGGQGIGTTHGSWNPYDSHIPLVFYGWKIKPGKTNRETYMIDAAPTIAAMLRIQMPSGSVGKVIEEITGNE